VRFAQEIVARFHSQLEAEKALQDFQTRAKGGIPDDVPEVRVDIDSQSIGIAQLLKMAGLVESTSEANRAIDQGGVKLDSEKVSDKNLQINKGITVVAQVGKRKFVKIKIE
jgi:tyrosyl-tRNA synthetase